MAAGSTSTTPISDSARKGRWVGVIIFSIFFLAGLGFLFPVALVPLYHGFKTSHWQATPCTILSSQVRSSRSSKGGSTYSPDIHYRYHVGKQTYESADDWLMVGSYGTSDAADLVRRYHPRQQATCYVNPANPAEAILSRDLPGKCLAMSFLPLLFMLIGGGGIYSSLRRSRQGSTALGTAAMPITIGGGFGGLRRKQGPGSRFLFFLVFTLFWNGMISLLFSDVVQSYRHGHGDLCETAFAIPFVLVGVGMLIGTVYSFLALFTPRPHISVARPQLHPGESSEVKWRFTGQANRISRLALTLEGREEATYRRGTNTVTDKSVFFHQQIADTTRPMEIASGGGKLTIPPGTMHTFAARNNKIVWELQLQGEITHWPDAKQRFEVIVLPAQVQR